MCMCEREKEKEGMKPYFKRTLLSTVTEIDYISAKHHSRIYVLTQTQRKQSTLLIWSTC